MRIGTITCGFLVHFNGFESLVNRDHPRRQELLDLATSVGGENVTLTILPEYVEAANRILDNIAANPESPEIDPNGGEILRSQKDRADTLTIVCGDQTVSVNLRHSKVDDLRDLIDEISGDWISFHLPSTDEATALVSAILFNPVIIVNPAE